ncbi:MAG: RHS repeat-associated core domain-containing protein, partial [Rhodocyclaceae bacterium]
PDGTLIRAAYTYDALSRRIAKTVILPDGRARTTRYGWDGELLVGEDDGERTTTIVYEPHRFVPLLRFEQPSPSQADDERRETAALISDAAALLATHGLALPPELHDDTPEAQVSVFFTDHLGTPLLLADTEGHTHWHAEPDDWAAVTNAHGIRQPIRFQGQWEDEESGFYYNRYRYYDPATGRYVTQDPIGLKGGGNLFNYPLNPLSRVDPLGQQSTPTQASNATDTAVNAATTYGLQGMTNASGGVISAGTGAANGAVAIGGVLRNLALKDYHDFMATGHHTINPRTCLGSEIHKIDWNDFDSFEEGLAHVGSICLKK